MKVEITVGKCTFISSLYNINQAESSEQKIGGVSKFKMPPPPPVPKKIEFIKNIDEDKNVKKEMAKPKIPSPPKNTELDWVKLKKDQGVQVKVTNKTKPQITEIEIEDSKEQEKKVEKKKTEQKAKSSTMILATGLGITAACLLI